MKIMILVLLVISNFAHASTGDLLSFKKIDKDPGYIKVYLQANRLKVDVMDSGNTAKNTVVYNKDANTITILDHAKKKFSVMDKEKMKAMSEKMGAAAAKMKEMLAKMPPEMQEMMKKKMAAMTSSPDADLPVEVKKMGSSEKVGRWSASHYSLLRGGKEVSELWSVPAKDIGVDKDNFEVLKSMRDLFADMGNQMKGMFGSGSPHQAQLLGFQKIEGVPVKTVSKSGKIERGLLLENAEKKSLSDSDFSVPAGYEENKMGVF